MIGKTLAHYEIKALLGKGGMGEVYRANDQKLQRDVAIKILPQEVSQEPERLARFDREARTLATLQHPNIASAYGLEEAQGIRFLVMELVEGEGLDDRMARGPIPPAEASRLAAQIACGLEAAHDKGIVHRDLKPANIRIAPDGTVKVLDFGLAKSWGGQGQEPDLSNSPTMTALATMQGVILGTAGYMSPEQARGHAVNKQTDIWAFGVLLWEMLSGQRLFAGTTVSDVMAGVLRAEIDDQELPGSTPPAIRRLLRRCLQRDLKRRLRDIGDAALELDETGEAEPSGALPGGRQGQRSTAWSLSLPAWLVILTLAVLGTWTATRLAVRAPHTDRAVGPVASFERMTFGEQAIFNARFLPDGRGIVYSGARFGNVADLQYLESGAKGPRRIAPAGTTLLSVSAQGELAVLTGAEYSGHRVLKGTLARMGIDGSPRPLIEEVRDADWGPDGELAIVRRVGGVDRLEYPVGNVLYETSGYVSDIRISPDGKQVAFLDHQWWGDDRGWVKLVDRSHQVTTLSQEFWAIEGLVWTPNGAELLFAGAEGEAKLNPTAVSIRDERVRTFMGLPSSTTILDMDEAGRLLALSASHTLGVVAHPRGTDNDIDLTWLDASWGPVLAADNKTLIFTNGSAGSNYAVVMRTIDSSPLTTLGEGQFKSLSPDGAWVAAHMAAPPGVGIYPTGTGTARHLDPGSIVQFHNTYWFPDSSAVLIIGNEAGGPLRCYRQAISGGAPEPLTIDGAVDYSLLTLDGKAVLGRDKEQKWSLYPLDGGKPRPLPGLHADDEIQAWNPEGSAIFITEKNRVPSTLTRVDLVSQKRTLDVTFGPARGAGLLSLSLNSRVFDPADGYAYGYAKDLSQLFVVEGARW